MLKRRCTAIAFASWMLWGGMVAKAYMAISGRPISHRTPQVVLYLALHTVQ